MWLWLMPLVMVAKFAAYCHSNNIGVAKLEINVPLFISIFIYISLFTEVVCLLLLQYPCIGPHPFHTPPLPLHPLNSCLLQMWILFLRIFAIILMLMHILYRKLWGLWCLWCWWCWYWWWWWWWWCWWWHSDDEKWHKDSLGKLAKQEMIWIWIIVVIIIILIVIITVFIIIVIIIMVAEDSLWKLARKESIGIEYWRFNGSHTSVNIHGLFIMFLYFIFLYFIFSMDLSSVNIHGLFLLNKDVSRRCEMLKEFHWDFCLYFAQEPCNISCTYSKGIHWCYHTFFTDKGGMGA